jgi:hypothetical protein
VRDTLCRLIANFFLKKGSSLTIKIRLSNKQARHKRPKLFSINAGVRFRLEKYDTHAFKLKNVDQSPEDNRLFELFKVRRETKRNMILMTD